MRYSGRMLEKRLPRSARKFLRRRKADIRRQFLSPAQAEEKIGELVQGVRQRYTRGGDRDNRESRVTKETAEPKGA